MGFAIVDRTNQDAVGAIDKVIDKVALGKFKVNYSAKIEEIGKNSYAVGTQNKDVQIITIKNLSSKDQLALHRETVNFFLDSDKTSDKTSEDRKEMLEDIKNFIEQIDVDIQSIESKKGSIETENIVGIILALPVMGAMFFARAF